MIGGSPCQGFSRIGKQLNFNDDRSKLFFVYVEILHHIKEVNPNIKFLLENVCMKPEYIKVINEALGVIPIKLNSGKIAAANRNRLYWANFRISPLNAKDITFDDIYCYSDEWLPPEYITRTSKWKCFKNPVKSAIIYGQNKKVPCLLARGYNRDSSATVLIRDGDKYRYLTDLEAERCMTLPENYTAGVPSKERSKCIGNGWTVDVIAHIFKGLK